MESEISKNKEIMHYEKISWIAIIVVGFFILCYFFFCVNTEQVCLDNEEVYPVTAWQIVFDDLALPLELPINVSLKEGEKVFFRTRLKKQVAYTNTILFWTEHAKVKVYLEKELIYQYGYQQKSPFSMPIADAWQIIRLPEDWEDKNLEVYLYDVNDQSIGALGEVFLGTKSAIVYTILKEGIFNLCCIVPLSMYGLFLIVFSFFYTEYDSHRKMLFLGMFSAVISVWILFRLRIAQIFFNNLALYYCIMFFLYCMLPIILNRYILCFESFKKSKWIQGCYILAIGNFFFVHMLQLFNVVSFEYSAKMTNMVYILSVICFILRSVFQYRKDKIVRDKDMVYAGTVFSIFILLEMVQYQIFQSLSRVRFIKIGAVLFVTILSAFTFKRGKAEKEIIKEQKLLKKIAYTDSLTGLKNRRAFEKEMDEFRNGELTSAYPIIVLADLNEFKQINDTMGHKVGDQAIALAAKVLDEIFSEIGNCYRIGGDEFCVIIKNFDPEAVEVIIEHYKLEIEEQGEKHGLPLKVACGYCEMDADGIDQAFICADKLMYADKKGSR